MRQRGEDWFNHIYTFGWRDLYESNMIHSARKEFITFQI